MKIRIKSNYLTRYVLQDYGNMEPLSTFTPFVLVLYFIYSLVLLGLLCLCLAAIFPLIFSYFLSFSFTYVVHFVFFRLQNRKLRCFPCKICWFDADMGNLWACFHMLFRINSGSTHLIPALFISYAAFDFHSTFITFSKTPRQNDVPPDRDRNWASEKETQFCWAHLLLKQMIAVRKLGCAFFHIIFFLSLSHSLFSRSMFLIQRENESICFI